MADRPEWVDEILRGIAGLDAGLERIEARLGAVEARLERVEAGLGAVEARLERVGARLERVEAEIPRLRGDMMARMDRLQDRLSQMIEDIGVNFGSGGNTFLPNTIPDIDGAGTSVSPGWEYVNPQGDYNARIASIGWSRRYIPLEKAISRLLKSWATPPVS